MKKSNFWGAIHAFMFCAFFFSFIFRSENYLLRSFNTDYCSLFAAYFNAEILAFAAGTVFFLWFAVIWNLRMHYRLFLILLLTLGCLAAWWLGWAFIAYVLAVAALSTALPFAVNYERFDPVRLFWGFLAVAPVVCFPNLYFVAGIVALIVMIAQREIPGIRFFGRVILAFMMITAFLFGSFSHDKKNIVPDFTSEYFRQNYELMMLAYAQHGAIPENTVSYFKHPWRSMNELSALVTKLSVDRNENMTAYFAGDQLRYSAEHDLILEGKHIPTPQAKTNLFTRPSVVLIPYPATGDYTLQPNAGNVYYYGDAWRNYAFYTVEGLTKQKKNMTKNGIIALQLPDNYDTAAPILAAVKKVFKHTVILRWSGIYVFASDRKLTADPHVLDRNAVNAGIYRYMYAPYRILLLALTTYQDDAEDERLNRAASDVAPRSLRDLPVLITTKQPHVAWAETIFRNILEYAIWILPVLFLLYCFFRYWYAGVPGAKLPFQSFETGLIAGVTFLIPALIFSLSKHTPLLKVISANTVTLFSFAAMIMLLFVRGKAASSFPVRILMAILCVCAFLVTDISMTLLCCISLLSGIAAVCAGQCPHRCRMSYWFLGMSFACLLTPFLWYSPLLFYPTGCIILCYILFAGYKQK